MKQMIVLAATIALGVFIYGLVAGDSPESILNIMSDMWKSGLLERSYYGR